MISTISDRLRGLVSLFWREVAKFGTVGGVAFVIDNGLTYLFMHTIMSDSEAKARFVGATVATIFSWVANRYWTFRHRKQANIAREFVMFAVINGLGIGISTGFTAIAKYWMDIQDKNLLFLAGVVGIVVATVVRFFAYRFWVFNQELDTEPGYEGDHEIFEHEHEHEHGHGHPQQASAAGAGEPGRTAAGPSDLGAAGDR
ncbi:GtrA family protein [Sinomonas soli]